MQLIRGYIEYLKDNPKGYWFKRKLYGWGWTPARWQGWLVVGLFLAAVFMFVRRLPPEADLYTVSTNVVVPLVVLIVILICISYVTGEPPKWMWGKKDSKQSPDTRE